MDENMRNHLAVTANNKQELPGFITGIPKTEITHNKSYFLFAFRNAFFLCSHIIINFFSGFLR
jgi:hypothetical protein